MSRINIGTADARTPLPAGTELIAANGIRYKIKNSAGAGGSALLYKAQRTGSLRNFILKECYPRSKKFQFTRVNKVIRALDGDAEAENYLALVKANMIRENSVGQLIANRTGRTIASWEEPAIEKIICNGETFDATGSYFVVLEEATDGESRGRFLEDVLNECAKPRQVDAPLRNGGVPAPHVAAAIMEELLKALRDIHKAGYVHGDINDANFFLMGADFALGDVGVGQLLDFGNAFKLEADGKTEPIKDVFSTEGYWSPEILENTGEIRLSPATDIYSAGCLMLYLFKGMRYKRACGKNLAKNFSIAALVPPKRLMKCGYRRESAILFGKILSKALAYNPEDRYHDAGEMLKEIIFLKKLLAPPKFALTSNLSRSPYFVKGSRDKELARLQNDLAAGTHPLWIWGIGGIGKTELAMEFARKQIEDGRPAYLAIFRGSIRETVLSLEFSGRQFDYDGAGDETEADYRSRLELLKETCADALLIIDNFDRDGATLAELQQEPAYSELVALNLKILFTTRSRPNDSVPELEPLNEENALTLFKSIAKVSQGEEKFVRKLILEVACHPMTVEILAHTLNESWGTLTAKELLAHLQAESLKSAKVPEVKHTKDRTEREEKIYGHLRTLFRLFNEEDSYREILCHATLLPLNGFDAGEFISCEESGKKKQLKQLESRGWLRRRVENNTLNIHPLIRTVFKNELKPTDADCEKFLSCMWERLDDRYPQERELFMQGAELFERAAADLSDVRGKYHFCAGFCYIVCGQYRKALHMEEIAVQRRENFSNEIDEGLARLYNDTGVVLGYTFEHERAMNYFEKAINVLNTVAPNDPNTANILTNTANNYTFLGQYDRALELAQRAVKIFERTPPKNPHEQANSYSILGNVLLWLQRYDEAKENFFVAAKILEKIAPEGSVELGRAYADIGQIFAMTGEHKPAIEYLLKAADIQEKILPKNTLEIMVPYAMLIKVYAAAGLKEESKKYSDMVAQMEAEIFSKELHETLTLALDKIEMRGDKMTADEFAVNHKVAAFCFRKLGNLESATKFMELAKSKLSEVRATELKEKIHAEAAELCAAKKNFVEAISHEKKALSFVTEDYVKTSKYFMRLSELSRAAGDFQEALNYADKAIASRLKTSHVNLDFIHAAQKAKGLILMDMKKFREAREIFQKILAKSAMNASDTEELRTLLEELQDDCI